MKEKSEGCRLPGGALHRDNKADEPLQAVKGSGKSKEAPAEKPLPDGSVQPPESMPKVCPAQPPEDLPPDGEANVKQGSLPARLILKLCFGNRRLAEIVRFAIVGVIATLADFIASGIVLYLFAPSLYTQFTDIFNSEGASVTAQCVSTGAGFLVGVVVNYLLSVFFVFEEKGNSKTALGFILFTALSAGGLAINVLGMYLLVDLAGWNYWLIKILLTCIVLVYNYLTRKFIIFRKRRKGE